VSIVKVSDEVLASFCACPQTIFQTASTAVRQIGSLPPTLHLSLDIYIYTHTLHTLTHTHTATATASSAATDAVADRDRDRDRDRDTHTQCIRASGVFNAPFDILDQNLNALQHTSAHVSTR
jgi:hypothetical protein